MPGAHNISKAADVRGSWRLLEELLLGSSLNFLHQGIQPLPKLTLQAVGNRRQLTLSDLAKKGRKVRERSRELSELGKGFFLGRTEVAFPEAGLGAGDGQGSQSLEHLGGQATAASRESFELSEQCIALLGPFGGSGEVTPSLEDFGQGVVILPNLIAVEGFADLASLVSVTLGNSEFAEAEVDSCELAS